MIDARDVLTGPVPPPLIRAQLFPYLEKLTEAELARLASASPREAAWLVFRVRPAAGLGEDGGLGWVQFVVMAASMVMQKKAADKKKKAAKAAAAAEEKAATKQAADEKKKIAATSRELSALENSAGGGGGIPWVWIIGVVVVVGGALGGLAWMGRRR